MNSGGWNSDSSDNKNAHNEKSSKDAAPQGEWSMEDVLRRTLDGGQADDVLETIAQLRRENPAGKPDEIDTMTRFVLAFLRRRFPDLPLNNEKVLVMAATIAQSLVEDPVASQRIGHLWSQAN